MICRGDLVTSREVLNDCLALVQNERWTAFLPWPETLRGDVDRAWHELGSAHDRYAHAYALACQLGDPCWEGMAAKGLGLLEADAGELEPALLWLNDARARCTRWPDAYQWVHGAVLDATCGIALDVGDRRGPRWVDELAALAARTGIRELVVRSHLHGARLDRPGRARGRQPRGRRHRQRCPRRLGGGGQPRALTGSTWPSNHRSVSPIPSRELDVPAIDEHHQPSSPPGHRPSGQG